MKPIKYRPEAEQDIDEGIDFYRKRDPGVEAMFLEAVLRQIERIANDTETGYSSRRGTRTQLVPKFPYAVVFKDYGEYALIVAVYNWNRKPDAWLDRLED